MKKYLFLLLFSGTLFSHAQNSIPVKKVTVFKNATAMLVKEGSTEVKDGSVSLPIPQQTLYGTFFIGASKDNAIKSMVFKNDTLKRKAHSNAVWQYLAGNLNKTVTLHYVPTQGIDKSVTGSVVDYDLYNGIMKFKDESGKTLIMHVGQIYDAVFKEDPSSYYMADSIKRMMVLKLEKAADNLSLQEIYMTGGINWIPSYYLRLKDDKTARLEMKATVENYAEDLKDAETELVVGSPQMSNSGKFDPMTYDYITSDGYNYANNEGQTKMYMQSNAMGKVAEAAYDGGRYFENQFSTEGEKTGDMYIYKLGKISLPYQSKGTFPIFAGNVEYKDKYEGSVPDITNYYNTRYVPQEERTFDIFHSLEVKNTSSVPLTTASVVVVNDKDQFIAQDELKYTPVAACTNVRLSKAIDIIMKNSEEEKTRDDIAKKIGKTNYSKVILKGTVNVDNFQNKEVTVTVTKSLSGTILSNNADGKVTKVNSYNYVNPSSSIKWEVKLGANEKKVLNYEYEVYFIP